MTKFDKIKNLFVMASIDGKLTHEETLFLSLRCTRWGLSEEQFNQALEYSRGPEASLELPPGKKARLEILRDLVKVMAVDGELAEVEKQLFALAAARMEIEQADIDLLLEEVIRGRR